MTLTSGLHALKQQDYVTAIALLSAYCDHHPNPQAADYLKAQMGLCKAYRATGDIPQALQCCTRLQNSPYPKVQQWAIQHRQALRRPKPEQALLTTMQQAIAQGQYELVISRLAALRLPPSSTASQLKRCLVEAYQHQGQREQAIAQCQALLTDPDPHLQAWAQQTLPTLTPPPSKPKGWWLKGLAVVGMGVGGLGWAAAIALQEMRATTAAIPTTPIPVHLPSQSHWQLSRARYALAFSPAVRREIIRHSQQGRGQNAPAVSEENTYYEIYGLTAEELLEEIPLRSPRMDYDSGRTAIATAALKPSWSYEFVQVHNSFCAIAQVQTTAEVVYTFPQWVDYAQANPQLQQRWDTFLNAVIRHEHRHRDILLAALAQVEPAILALEPQPNCDQAVTEANAVIQRLIDASNEQQRHFDATDDHPDYYALRSLMVEEWRDRYR